VYQAGTLSGNPLAMAAGIATLEVLAEPDAYTRLETAAARLAEGLAQAAAEAGLDACVQRVGSMLSLFFAAGPVTDYASAKRCDTAAFGRFHGGMLARGVYLPPSQFEAWFVSLAHGQEEIERTLEAARQVLPGVA
jgi:glutamate-1-semialdehyde 2,1-aminomutase